MRYWIATFLLLIALPALGADQLTVQRTTQLMHPGYYNNEVHYSGAAGRSAFNSDNTKILMQEVAAYTSETYATTGRAYVWANIADLIAACHDNNCMNSPSGGDLAQWLTDYQAATTAMPQQPNTNADSARWSPLASEPGIIYYTYRTGGTSYLKRLDTSDDSMTTVATVGTTGWDCAYLYGFNDSNEALVTQTLDYNYPYAVYGTDTDRCGNCGGAGCDPGQDGWLVNISTGGKTQWNYSDHHESFMGCTFAKWDQLYWTNHAHGHISPSRNYWASSYGSGTHGVSDRYDSCSFDVDPKTGSTAVHVDWPTTDDDWFLGSESPSGCGGYLSAPHMCEMQMFQIHYDPTGGGTFNHVEIAAPMNAGRWEITPGDCAGDNGSQYKVVPYCMDNDALYIHGSTDGTMAVYKATSDGLFSREDKIAYSGAGAWVQDTDWSFQSMYLLEFTSGATPIVITTPLTPDGVQTEGITSINLEATTDLSAYCFHDDTSGFDFVPESIWEAGEVPSWGTDQNPVEQGVKFQSSKAGYITKIKFYKKATNTGTHTGSIWSAGGSLLATGTFTNESASGWQTLTLTTPLAIAADTTYVASYYNPTGNWSGDGSYFTTSYTNNYLTVLQDGGVYTFSGTSAFPTSTFQSYNYWVDVVFSEGVPYGDPGTSHSVAFTVAADTAYTRYVKCAADEAGTNISAEAQYSFSVPADAVPPTVTSWSPVDTSTGVSLSVTPIINFSEAMTPLTTNTDGTEEATAALCICLAAGTTAADCCDNANSIDATIANPTTTQAVLTPGAALAAATLHRVAVDTTATNTIPTAIVATSITFTTEAGTPPSPPSLQTVTNDCTANICSSGDTDVVLTATSEGNGYCRYSTTDEDYTSMSDQFTGGEGGTSHTVTVTSLVDDTSYTYYVECDNAADGSGEGDGYRVATSLSVADGVDPPSPAFTYTLTPTGLTYSVVNGATNPNGTSYTDGAWTAWSCFDRVTGQVYNSAVDYDFVGADLSGTITIPAENFDLLCYTQAWDDDSNTSSVNTYSVKRQNGMSSGASN